MALADRCAKAGVARVGGGLGSAGVAAGVLLRGGGLRLRCVFLRCCPRFWAGEEVLDVFVFVYNNSKGSTTNDIFVVNYKHPQSDDVLCNTHL